MQILESLHGFPTPEKANGGNRQEGKNEFLYCAFNLSGLNLLMFDLARHMNFYNTILHSSSASHAVFVVY